jgi:hypothetical protein
VVVPVSPIGKSRLFFIENKKDIAEKTCYKKFSGVIKKPVKSGFILEIG